MNFIGMTMLVLYPWIFNRTLSFTCSIIFELPYYLISLWDRGPLSRSTRVGRCIGKEQIIDPKPQVYGGQGTMLDLLFGSIWQVIYHFDHFSWRLYVCQLAILLDNHFWLTFHTLIRSFFGRSNIFLVTTSLS